VPERRTGLVVVLVLVAAAVFVGAPVAVGFGIDWTHPPSAIRGILALAAAVAGLVGLALLAGRALAPPAPPSDLLTRPSEMTARHARLLPDGLSYRGLLDRITEQSEALEFITDRVRLSRAHVEKSDTDRALWHETIRKQEQGRDDLRRALAGSTATLDRIIAAESSRERGSWAPGAALAIVGTVGFLAALLTVVPAPAIQPDAPVLGRFERIATSASRQLWEAASLEQCEVAEDAIEVIVLSNGTRPRLQVVPNGPDCEAVEFTVTEGSGILLLVDPSADED
jgi:hypothetical protein